MVADLESICNYLRISDDLGTAGQPTPDQFTLIREAGYEVVVNLAMPTSTNALPNEPELVTGQGMGYFHIPVEWEDPTAADLDRFFAMMDHHQAQRVFVHCALNMRVSAFVFLYRVIRLGVPVETAWQSIERIWEPNAVWMRFIRESLSRYGFGEPGAT